MADCEEEDGSRENLTDFFTEATKYVRTLQGLSDEHRLLFYGLFKQAKEGPCITSRPGFWDMVGRAKWDSWHQLGNMTRELAMTSYIEELYSIDPEWDIKSSTSDENPDTEHDAGSKQSMGMGVSTLRGSEDDEVISDVNKNIFDWCKEGDVKKMNALLSTDLNINSIDEQGMSLLHWACDRGHEHVVDFLIKHNADINIKDTDGQTPLHYAATCEFSSIVQQLLAAKALTDIKDVEGCLPCDATDNKAIKELLERR